MVTATKTEDRWVRTIRAAQELHVSRYMVRRYVKYYGLEYKRGGFDTRNQLINITELKRKLAADQQ